MNAKTARSLSIVSAGQPRTAGKHEERREKMRCEKAILAIRHQIEEAAHRAEQQVEIFCNREPSLWDVNWNLYFEFVLLPLENDGFACQIEHASGFDTRCGYFSPYNDYFLRVRWDGQTYSSRYLRTVATSTSAKVQTK